MFGNGNWSSGGSNCNSLNPTTFQIVLYESTGIIEVNIERKACNATVGTGFNAILGIQNWARIRQNGLRERMQLYGTNQIQPIALLHQEVVQDMSSPNYLI